jgi:hypothetical protein
MRIFVTGDVHAEMDYKKLKLWRKEMKGELTLDDYLIVCGDFGVLWDSPRHDKYFTEKVYGAFPCTILWVCGNHENFDTLYTYEEEPWMGGKIRRITDRILHLSRGEVFTLANGIKFLAFGGAKSTDRGYDTGYNKYWWPQELPNQNEKDNALKNLAMHNNAVDYIFTHDAPQSVIRGDFGLARETEPDFASFMETLASTANVKHGWYFGHYHKDESHGKYHCMYHSVKELTL